MDRPLPDKLDKVGWAMLMHILPGLAGDLGTDGLNSAVPDRSDGSRSASNRGCSLCNGATWFKA